MKKEEFIKEIKKLPIELTEEKLNKLEIYYEFLIKYNENVNLTAIINKEEVYLKHFFDSLTTTKIFNFNLIDNLIDVGTGAGFPGVVLKIFFPKIKVTLLDSNNKKTMFLEKLITKLNLNDVEIVCDRSENYIKRKINSFDLVIARAVKNLDILLELCLPLVKEKKYFISMKANINNELNENIKVINYFDCELVENITFKLPDDSTRTLILIKKKTKAKKIYPRDYSQITKKPLKNVIK